MWILVSFAAMVRSCHATNSVSRRLQEIIVVPIEASLGGGGLKTPWDETKNGCEKTDERTPPTALEM